MILRDIGGASSQAGSGREQPVAHSNLEYTMTNKFIAILVLWLGLFPLAIAHECTSQSFKRSDCEPRPTEDDVAFYKSIATEKWTSLHSAHGDFVSVRNTDPLHMETFIFFTNLDHPAHPSYVEISFPKSDNGRESIAYGFTAADCQDFDTWKASIEASISKLVGEFHQSGT